MRVWVEGGEVAEHVGRADGAIVGGGCLCATIVCAWNAVQCCPGWWVEFVNFDKM